MIIEETILINAEMDKVWETFTDLTCWEDWNTVMRNVCSVEKYLSIGGNILCSFRPFLLPIKAAIRVEEVIPHKQIVWSAKKKGFSARNKFTFQSNERGVIVTSRETFSGAIVKSLGFLLPKRKMRTLIKTFLRDLKNASEKQLVL
ncbi:MAG: hypothetical protein A2Z47_03860 [Thermodesulfovibrio sp. RBG_19FT_COMBO_42_12]|nr:MAG: hypothetical protein A2Z47_03860 [Thermodesulfovibrio sp. RBG_19FT_COMBO_42_12]